MPEQYADAELVQEVVVSDSSFTVDPEGLRSLGGALHIVSALLSTVGNDNVRGLWDDLGSKRITKALTTFDERWSWQARKLSDSSSDIAGRLKTCAQQYDQVEETQLQIQSGRG